MELSPQSPGQVTTLLSLVRRGDRAAFDRLLGLVYDELKLIARRQLNHERAGHTLHPTALVHEAYLKLSEQPYPELRDRAHFLAIAARAMRQVLIDYARQRAAEKRGGGWERTTLGDGHHAVDVRLDELLALDAALAELSERQRRVVEYRFFAGMSEQEIAAALGVTERTVRRDWVKARAWLHAELAAAGG